MDDVHDDHRLGDYRLTELLAEGPRTRTWLAEQISVRRSVLIERLMDDAPDARTSFLAGVRAQASVDHPQIGSVYEAVSDGQGCFSARERLPGRTLEERLLAGETLPSLQLAHALRRVAEANLYLEERGLAAARLGPGAIHLDDQGVTRLTNLALAGKRGEDESVRDITALGAALPPLVTIGQPGASRLQTLLRWMRGEELERPLTWRQVLTYAGQIERQLSSGTTSKSPSARRSRPLLVAGGAVIVLAALAAGVVMLRQPQFGNRLFPLKPSGPDRVFVAAGSHPAYAGGTVTLPAFHMASHEVTIRQYAAFLDSLAVLARARREKTFDHVSQPNEKTGHQPDDWDSLYAAAKTEGAWRGHPVTLDTPVVGVDWWDAAAYCEWKQGRLPTQEEWFAALSAGAIRPEGIKPSNWLPVTAETPDETPAGLAGMAGSVAEWTASQSANPANPLGRKLWVIAGGSYLKPVNGALAREWVESRALRRPDLGFRVAWSAE